MQTNDQRLRALSAIPIALGLVLLIFGSWELALAIRCMYWPTIDGIVQDSAVVSHNSHPYRRSRTTFGACISYEYKVADAAFTGTRVYFGDQFITSSTRLAQDMVDRYPPRKIVRVSYAPGNPELAALESGIHAGLGIAFGLGALLLGAGLVVIWATRPNEEASHYGW